MAKENTKNADLFIFLALLFQFIVLILRVIASMIWNNYAILIESFHIAIDISITFLVLVSLKLSRSSLRNRYSYGLYKIEDLTSLFIAIVVAVSAFDILRSSFFHEPTGDLQSSIIQFISLAPLFLSGRTKIIASKIMNSTSLKSDGLHTYTDVYEGLGVGAGLLLNYISKNNDFYYASIAIAAFTLFYTSYEIGRDSIISLLDLPKDKNFVLKIEKEIRNNVNVKEIKSIKVRWAGPVIFVEIILVVSSKLTIEEAHVIADNIENNLYNKMPEIKDVVIHLEPSVESIRRIAIPEDNGKISERFARAFEYVIYEADIKNKTKKKLLSVESVQSERKNAQKLMKILMEYSVTDVITVKVGEIAEALLRERNIEIWLAKGNDPLENIDYLLEGKLNKINYN